MSKEEVEIRAVVSPAQLRARMIENLLQECRQALLPEQTERHDPPAQSKRVIYKGPMDGIDYGGEVTMNEVDATYSIQDDNHNMEGVKHHNTLF